MKKLILISGLIFGLGLRASAAELYESNLSVRALGMGNAYSSVVSDVYALFYNPARLAAVDGFNFRLMDPYVTVSDPTKLTEVVDAGSEVQDILDAVFDKNASAGIGTRASFAMPRFGVALFGDGQLSVNVDNPVFPDLTLRAVGDYGGVVGLAVPIIPGFVDAGIVVKRVVRNGGLIPISATTLAELDLDLIQNEIKRRGGAFGMDLALSASLPGPIDASASFIWKNVGGMSFKASGSAGKPPSESDEMIVSFAGGVDLGLAGVTAALDFKHIEDSDQLGKKIHVGVEVNLFNLDFRAGLYQGYYTLGLGVGLGLLQLDVATYGVELGEYAGQRQDRRYALQLTLELGVDPFFSLGSGSNSSSSGSRKVRRRGIKQRR